jgi:hypothetical protein
LPYCGFAYIVGFSPPAYFDDITHLSDETKDELRDATLEGS